MSYTLANAPLWLAVAGAAGLAIGWSLRAVAARRAPLPAAAEPTELAQLRAHAARCADECERLEAELEDCRHRAEVARVAVVGAVVANAVAEQDLAAESVLEREGLVAAVAAHESTIGELRARLWNQDAKVRELQAALAARSAAAAPPPPDLAAATMALGEKVRHNDLTVIEGIGPKIADMLQREGGIRTWWDLHCTDVARLRELLDEAGPRFQVHDPSTWPQQAGLLARGEWQQFTTLVAALRSGKLGG